MDQNSHNKKGAFDSLSSKSAFWLGVIGSLAIAFTVGFFILLGIMLSDDKDDRVAINPQPAAAAGEPTARGVSPSAMKAVSDSDHMRGSTDAKVTVVEYSDLECPFCGRFHPTVQQIVDDYDGQVNWVYRHFPLNSIHPKAQKQAEASECVAELGGNDAFWAFIDDLFTNPPATNDALPGIAASLGVNQAAFSECLDSGKHAVTVQDMANDGIAAGAQGTPFSVIVSGDQRIPLSGAVPASQLKAIIDPLLQ